MFYGIFDHDGREDEEKLQGGKLLTMSLNKSDLNQNSALLNGVSILTIISAFLLI